MDLSQLEADLIDLIEYGDDEDLREKLMRNPDLLKDPKNKDFGFRLLRKAIIECEDDKIDTLIEFGVDVEFEDPVRIGLSEGYVSTVKSLLKNGCKLKDQETLGEIVFKRKNVWRPDMLELLFKYGLKPTLQTQNGKNLLQQFIKNLDWEYADDDDYDDGADVLEVVRVLLESGIPIDEPCSTDSGNTPLIYAIKSQNAELVSYLIKKGADVQKFAEHEFPLYAAAAFDNLDIVKMLVLNGVDVNTRTRAGWSPLHSACYSGDACNKSVIKFLLNKGADLNAENNSGETPLFNINLNHDLCVDIMVKKIAKLRSIDNSLISAKNINFILAQEKLQQHYEKYMKDLDRLANTKFYGSYSYHCVLMMSKNLKKLANLVKNEIFLENFEKNLPCTNYKNDLRKILNAAIKMNDESVVVYSRLGYIFGKVLPDVTVRKLAENLNIQDLPLE